MIICDDADLARAASAASMGRFYNCGQACLAIKRVYVFESVADEVVEAIAAKAGRLRVGIGSRAAESRSGPLHSERQRETLERQSADAWRAAARLLVGGGRPDDPALVRRLVPRADRRARAGRTTRRWRREEVFGPVLPIWRVTRLRRGARRSPMTSPFGLGSSVWTAGPGAAPSGPRPSSTAATRGSTPARRSTTSCRSAALKASGYGKEHGSEALDYYTDRKSVVVKTMTAGPCWGTERTTRCAVDDR